jgi:dTDP-L-rhamnose 4-epimerase
MAETVLITGGAGFIGSHLCDELLRHGYRVRVLDNLSPQVHGADRHRPAYLSAEVDLRVGDVRDPAQVEAALDGMDIVVHLAARVGVGQSMYEIAEYTSVNVQGTAVLLEALMRQPVRRLLVASSMSIYGEGLYREAGGAEVFARRTSQDLAAGKWEVHGPDGAPLMPVPTPETKMPDLASVYALGKYQQERLCLIFGEAYQVPAVALRFFNVYGPRQALSNPYTGVLAIFASRLLNDNPPLIYEDGGQRRDFVHVSDVVRACRLALEAEDGYVAGQAFNIGGACDVSIGRLAALMAEVMGKDVLPVITGRYRKGDIRHCFADVTHAQRRLDYWPQVSLDDGIRGLVPWLVEQRGVEDRSEQADAELRRRGLSL